MTTIALFCFSGTGNTRWLSGTLASRLRDGGADVDLFSLEDAFTLTKRYDRYLLAHPVYGAHVPRIVIEKVQTLLSGDRHVSVITTFGYVDALGYFAEKKALGRPVDAYYHVRMFNNITTPEMKVPVKPPEKRLEARARLETRIGRIAASILSGRRKIEGIGPQLLAGIGVRKHFHERIQSFYRTLGTDQDRCTRCGLCIRECPTHSIEDRDGVFSFHATCTACMRCYNHCPVQAITISGAYADPETFPRYRGPWE